MPAAASGPRRIGSRVVAFATSFAVLHAVNAIISMSFNIVQFFVLARVLEPSRFSEVILLTAISFYVLPISQAVGRANFVALRQSADEANMARAANEASAILYLHGALMLLLACAVPLMVGAGNPREAIESVLYVAVCLANNLWYYDIQPTVWALDLGKRFERVSMVRRLIMFCALPLLWITGSFLTFVVVMAAATVAFMFVLPRYLPLDARPFRFRPRLGPLRWRDARAYLGLFWPALLSSLTELVVLNSPYLLFALAFGAGPAIVAYDTVMKLTRLAMTVARNLSESALPRLSRMFFSGDKAALGRLLGLLFGVCLAEGVCLAALMVAAGPFVFRLLLGPNDVIPPGTQYVAACAILTGCIYQPATYFLAFNGARDLIQKMTFAAVFGLAVFAGLVLSGALGLTPALWAYTAYFAAVAVLSVGLSLRLVQRMGGLTASIPPGAAGATS
ncbi:hypothetical protein [Methylobacterium sp. R2-1]|uniref:hypothetical protein n=1 Tax=Methylobacterium sp. R2-1 TaxID=2587064 RepID=UPI001615A697|nr:hypothetical protein [Methylobacterium sp. R2-1]MBB2964907.1 O-antigen/teichoic acid export membrane protein [Methylobacterium sp. R2-1]